MQIADRAGGFVRRMRQPVNILVFCLTGLALFPLIAAAMFYVSTQLERDRAESRARVAMILLGVQDAEVDFALARRSVVSYLRADDPEEMKAARAKLESARNKLANLIATTGDQRIAALHAGVAAYDDLTIAALGRVARRRALADNELRELGARIDADIVLYATRFERGGLAGLAAEMAQARIRIASSAIDPGGPDQLAATARLPLDLADTAEIAAPAARAIVRRIDANLGRFVAHWREMNALYDPSSAARIAAAGPDLTVGFDALTNLLSAQLVDLRGAARDLGARLDMLLGATIAVVAVLAGFAARAIWHVFVEQRDRAARETRRRTELEAALARLDAAIRARRADGTGAVTLTLPEAPPPAPPPSPPSKPALPSSPAAAAKTDPAPPEQIKPAEPDTDELIKMLMMTLGPTPDAKK